MDGVGYDSAGRNLGIGVSKTFTVTRKKSSHAIAEVEKELGDLVGRKLTAWSGQRKSMASESSEGGAAQVRSDALENTIEVRLDGATKYELTEVFGKVLNTARGVANAKRYGMHIQPDNPQACYSVWRTEIEDTDPFRLQANMLKMVDDILRACGDTTLNGVQYRLTSGQIDLLAGLRAGDATSRSLRFVIDRELARDQEFSGMYKCD